ncbi:MAG: 30S ribosomal protein S3ae [Candidatus Aenigmatarchaeota archaeon]
MVKSKGRDTWRMKEWYDILAPPMFGSSKIGETLASDPEKVKGRVIDTTLGDLIDDFSKSHVKIFFKIKEVEDHTAKTEFVGHDMSREYVRSQISRRVTKIDCITDVKSSDGRDVRITSMAVTLQDVQNSQKKGLHKRMDEYIKEKASEYEFTQLAQQMVLGKLASDVYKEIRQICPIRRVELKKSKLIGEES